ncbi:MAG: hypothetical protein AAF388_00330 [Bacteroidota bacterium]
MIKKEYRAVLEQYQNKIRFDIFSTKNLNDLGRLFCALPNEQHRALADTQYCLYRHRLRRIQLEPELTEKIYRDILELVEWDVLNSLEIVEPISSKIADDVYRQVVLSKASISDFSRTYLDMLDFCGHRCSHCHGVCIGTAGHAPREHRHYHVPLLLTGETVGETLI